MTTQHCAECGTRAEPGQSFCDSCGAVLGWDRAGARTSRPAAAAVPREAADHSGPAPAPRGMPDSAPVGGRNDTDTTADATTDGRNRPATVENPAHAPAAPAAHEAGDTAPTVPVAPVAASGADADAPDSSPESDRARSLLVPVADPDASSPAPPPSVAPVLPGRPDADRPQVRGPGFSEDVGNGPPCPWCSTPNRPDRHFCARCAMPLADDGAAAQPPGRRPWWRRLFDRQRDTPWAGERPPLRRVFDRIGTWIAAAVALTLIVLGILYIPDGVDAGRDHFAKRAPVAPDGVRASRSYPGHQPQLAFDKRSNTWWGPGVAQSGQGEWIEVTFAEPTRLLDVIITPGVSARADKLGASALPHRIKATVTLKDGKTTTRDITLDQGAGGQRRPFRVGEAVKVRLTIESAYAASGDKQVALAEVEFFGRSSSNRI
ncbi:zinc ribbon domain-containing protein [Streptomyces sp. BPTC-684]|uniref:zinc ribbon domain-containing protein n=1 Tax=Streptomyces sp. BPTC-684 TaxID=3043734 RepID=UPI0024B063AD|nr:zinc ribbon domain-containing protein [Streptomyces sp. BPTC-684]WHM40705.1 zinc ribbon domain-containing protein [Streptomyces sp. BPTC-684]